MLLFSGIAVVWDTVRCHGGSRSPLGQRPGEVSLPGSVLEGLELLKTAPGLCFYLSVFILVEFSTRWKVPGAPVTTSESHLGRTDA